MEYNIYDSLYSGIICCKNIFDNEQFQHVCARVYFNELRFVEITR